MTRADIVRLYHELVAKYKQLNSEQRKLVWFIAAVALAIGFLMMPSFSSLRRAVTPSRTVQQRKPSAFATAIPAPARPATAPSPVTPPPTVGTSPAFSEPQLLGMWQGQGVLPQRGVCTLRLELRAQPQEHVAGFSTLSCRPLTPPSIKHTFADTAMALSGRMNSSSAILNGTAENGALTFHVDQNIIPNEGCPMTSFKATPFGTNQIATQWDDGSCGGGQIMLRR